MALGFDLVPDVMKEKVLDHLLIQIEKADNHLRTGFLGTPLLAPVLDENGHADLMYSILFQETYPSWFYSINQGATTMWERWNSYSHEDGFGSVSMNSFNNYSYGAIGQWMYERIAGLQPLEAGYKKILIAPLPGGPLSSAKARYESMYGTISSEWKKNEDGLEIRITIPPNTTARVKVPMEEDMTVFLDGKPITETGDVKVMEQSNNIQVLKVEPGTYQFIVGHHQ